MKNFTIPVALLILISLFFGVIGGVLGTRYYTEFVDTFPWLFSENKSSVSVFPSDNEQKELPRVTTEQEQAVINIVKEVSPSVVSILLTRDVSVLGDDLQYPFYSPLQGEQGTEKQEIGGGSGFIISSDGLILTNKHVVEEENVDYTVVTNDGEKYEAQVLARDPIQDLAVLKIEKDNLPVVHLGDSDNLQIGQSVIAIGNALGEFQNTVSTGIVSGLSRDITATDGRMTEIIEEVIQTDAAINRGNSGGTLLNLSGEVIGVNTAMASGAENIGFAIPVNKAKKAIQDTKEKGKITYPFLGVRYLSINQALQKQYNLPVNYGAWVVKGEGEAVSAITPGSGADKAGIQENDIILEVNSEKITEENSLSKIILSYNIGDEIKLKILRQGEEMELTAELGER